MTVRDPEFWLRMDPRLKKVHDALEQMIKAPPEEYSTEELIQIWATLDYAHATMRGYVYTRPDVAEQMTASVQSVQERLLKGSGA